MVVQCQDRHHRSVGTLPRCPLNPIFWFQPSDPSGTISQLAQTWGVKSRGSNRHLREAPQGLGEYPWANHNRLRHKAVLYQFISAMQRVKAIKSEKDQTIEIWMYPSRYTPRICCPPMLKWGC
jgi:hypothetical protein